MLCWAHDEVPEDVLKLCWQRSLQLAFGPAPASRREVGTNRMSPDFGLKGQTSDRRVPAKNRQKGHLMASSRLLNGLHRDNDFVWELLCLECYQESGGSRQTCASEGTIGFKDRISSLYSAVHSMWFIIIHMPACVIYVLISMYIYYIHMRFGSSTSGYRGHESFVGHALMATACGPAPGRHPRPTCWHHCQPCPRALLQELTRRAVNSKGPFPFLRTRRALRKVSTGQTTKNPHPA